MRRAVAIAFLICLIPHSARADGRISFRFDFNKTNVKGAYSDIGFDWQGLEFEFDKEFRPSTLLLSGFALGVRRELFYAFTGFGGVKDVDRWDEGTYLTLRLYRSFEISSNRSWGIGPVVLHPVRSPRNHLGQNAGEPIRRRLRLYPRLSH